MPDLNKVPEDIVCLKSLQSTLVDAMNLRFLHVSELMLLENAFVLTCVIDHGPSSINGHLKEQMLV